MIRCPFSSLERRAACPGSGKAEAEVPYEDREPPGPAAIEGTRRHALMAYMTTHPGAPWPTTVKMPHDSSDTGLGNVTSKDVEACKIILPYFNEHPCRKDEVSGLYLVEQRVDLSPWLEVDPGRSAAEKTCQGIVDAIMATQTEYESVELKFGRFPVSPDSLQLKANALAGGSKLNWANEHQLIARGGTVKLTVAQPTQDEPIRSKTYPITEMEAWKQQITDIVKGALDQNAVRIPGENQCKFCAARHTCRARLDGMAEAMYQVSPTPEPSTDVIKAPAPIATVDMVTDLVDSKMTQDVSSLSVEEISKLLDMKPLVSGFLKDIEEHALKLELAGTNIPGYKAVSGRGKREWIGDEKETERGLRQLGFKVGDMYSKTMLSVAQMETKAKTMLLQKPRGAKAFEKFKGLFNTKEGKPTLVPDADKRSAIGDGMFEPITQTPKPQTINNVVGDSDLPEWMK